MRKSQQLVAGSLVGAALFWLLARFGDASARREAAAHGRTYTEDTPSKIVWVGIGAFSGVLAVTAGPVLRLARRHPGVAGVVGLVASLFGVNWVFWDAAVKAEKIIGGGSAVPSSPGPYRPRDWKLSGGLPSAADDMLGIGPSWVIRRHPLSDGAYFDAVGADAERQMAEEYQRTGRLPGDFAS